ncbi:MAG: nickel-dependent lactate racemase [Deltaproteobacteria bacterium]|jgi:hypothetical protein|nr:nickel-dependent lactate racemase [Deltaproteobacteria bacterium]
MIPGYVKLVENYPLPSMALIRQHFDSTRIADIPAALAEALASPVTEAVKPGMSLAITAGSRGIAQLVPLLGGIVDFVKRKGAHPFIVPAMGSHGGATDEGQRLTLTRLGVTGESVGCPIRSSMETVEVGVLDNGMSVRMDKLAHEADGIILFNRIKPHTDFRAPIESGLVKMISIGLGKQSGADNCHLWGFDNMSRLMTEMARVKLARSPFLFGVGSIENAYDQVKKIVLIAPDRLFEEEPGYLQEAMRNMPRLPIGPLDAPLAGGPLDVLVVDKVGKEYSGTGMDPNITGRPSSPAFSGGPKVKRIAVLDVTDKSGGNANGVGAADVITERLFDRFDRESVYMNCLTCGLLRAGALPLAMPTDKSAIQAAVKTCESTTPEAIRMLRIPNTLHLEHLYASEAMLPELGKRPGVEILTEAAPMRFDAAGRIQDLWPE